jgi:hypothetical protein
MYNFNPKIDRSVFKKIILGILENEGNNIFVVKKIKEELQISSEIYFFEQFVKICKKYKIEFKQNINLKTFEVIIITNGYESFKIEYNDKEKDITVELANILYRQLSTQIMNNKYIDDVKKNYR